MSLAERRREYSLRPLLERDVAADPFDQFQRWFDEVHAAELLEPTAMTLATATPDGRPSARTVLLKGLDERGFVFFSNYASRKGREMEANPHAALLFWWDVLERQVRIEGTVERVSDAESDAYFASRPVESKLGAVISPQSEVIPDRRWLEERMEQLRRTHPDGNVPRPETWGGTRLVPVSFEFWQGRPGRVHDRIHYRKDATRGWVIERLAP